MNEQQLIKCAVLTIAKQEITIRDVVVKFDDQDTAKSMAKRAYLQSNGVEAQAAQYDAYRIGNGWEIVKYKNNNTIEVMAEVIVGI